MCAGMAACALSAAALLAERAHLRFTNNVHCSRPYAASPTDIPEWHCSAHPMALPGPTPLPTQLVGVKRALHADCRPCLRRRLALAVGDGLLVTSGCLLSPGPLTLALHPRTDSAEGAVMAAATPVGWQAVCGGRGGAALLPAGGGTFAAALCVPIRQAPGAAGRAAGALRLQLRSGVATGSDQW